MIKRTVYFLALLYSLPWIRFEPVKDVAFPIPRLLAWWGGILIIGAFLLSPKFKLYESARKAFFSFLLFMLYLILTFFYFQKTSEIFNIKLFLMDFSKYFAIFSTFAIVYFGLSKGLVNEQKFVRFVVISGKIAIFGGYIFLGLYFLGFRTTNEIFAPSFGGALGVWPAAGVLPRIAGFTAEPQQFSVAFLTPLLILCGKSQFRRNRFIILLGLIILLLSQSKFALLSLMMIFLFMFIEYKKYRSILVIFGIISLLPIGFLVQRLPSFSETLAQGGESMAFVERLDNLYILIEIIKKNFLFGIGAGQYGVFRGYLIYGDPSFLPNYYPNLDLLKVFSETGIVGFLFIFGTLFYLFIKFFKLRKTTVWSSQQSSLYLAFFIGALTIFLNMFIGYELLHTFFWVNLGFLLYYSRLADQRRSSANNH